MTKRQLEDAGLALGNLHLDLIRLRSTGLAVALEDVSTATQQARALTRDIATAMEAVAEVRTLQREAPGRDGGGSLRLVAAATR